MNKFVLIITLLFSFIGFSFADSSQASQSSTTNEQIGSGSGDDVDSINDADPSHDKDPEADEAPAKH